MAKEDNEKEVNDLLDEIDGVDGKSAKSKDKPAEKLDPNLVKMMVSGEIEISKLNLQPHNREIEPGPLAELTESIRLKGLLIPIIVNKKHEVIDGHYRIQACKSLGFTKIPFIIKDKDTDDSIIIANYIRTNLKPDYVRELLDRKKKTEGKTQELMAKELGLSQSRISQICGVKRKNPGKKHAGRPKSEPVPKAVLPANVRLQIGKNRVDIAFTLDDEMLKSPEKSIVALFREIKDFAGMVAAQRGKD